MQALDQGDIYYDAQLKAVFQAEGTFDSTNLTHDFTMLWPTYCQAQLHDNAVKLLISAQYDHWSNILKYFDATSNTTVTIDLKNMSSQSASVPAINHDSSSQKNLGWAQPEEKKKQKFPFPIKTMLFHKTSRTKWIFDEIDKTTNHPILRSFYNKNHAMQIFERDYEEFEEIFF